MCSGRLATLDEVHVRGRAFQHWAFPAVFWEHPGVLWVSGSTLPKGKKGLSRQDSGMVIPTLSRLLDLPYVYMMLNSRFRSLPDSLPLSSLDLVLVVVFLKNSRNCSPPSPSTCPSLAEIVWPQSPVPCYSNSFFLNVKGKFLVDISFKACSEESCDWEHLCRKLALHGQESKLIFCTN